MILSRPVATSFTLGVQTALLLLALLSMPAHAVDWPQEVAADEGVIVVYQPQPDSLKGNTLTGRSAMSLQVKDQEPIFGAFWFSAKIDTDQDTDTVLVRDVKVTQVRWPDSKDAGEQRFTQVVESAIPKAGFEISLERLSASLATAEVEKSSLAELKNDPPQIIFKQQLAVLLSYDGAPSFSPVENSVYERALNTPLLVVRNKKSRRCYLSSGVFWYEAADASGPWQRTSSPPADLVAMLPEPEGDTMAPASAPEIVVASEATELVVSDGKPNWSALGDGNVLYVTNTETPWLRDLPTGNMYLLLSGRWYRAKTGDGPWTFVPADELPPSFADIPPASEIGGLRTSVAGTSEANDAVLDASIPQTAAIKKSDASLSVEYDGKPEFEAISGTNVAYAVNTGAQVLKINKQYYAVDNGVWYVSSAAEGPWQVADSVPEDEIAKIPPSSPVYNTTHVHIYESTPEVVYVGYTPGYLWSFPYYGVPVYGTGWYYPPYMGRYYYPRPPTWGFHVGYNPWSGWNFGVSWSSGFFSMGARWGGGYGHYRPGRCCGGWYGGGYRRPPVVINTGNINIGNTVNVGNRTHIGKQVNNNVNINNNNLQRNIYQQPQNKSRNADRATVQRDMQQARTAKGKDNNVYASKNGDVARRSGDEWQSRQDGKWQADPALNDRDGKARDASPQSRDQARQKLDQASPEQKQKAADSAHQKLQPANNQRHDYNRANQARQHGASRERANRGGGAGGRGRQR
jgi:hypothetical protein